MMIRWTGNIACMGEEWNAYRILVMSEGKRPIGRSKRRKEDIIKNVS
jgi:hypothetical protein